MTPRVDTAPHGVKRQPHWLTSDILQQNLLEIDHSFDVLGMGSK